MNNSQPPTIEDELKKHDFRVAIFGSARIKPDDQIFKDTCRLAESLARDDIDIVTGGGPGLMEAANHGQRSAGNQNSDSIGLTIELPSEAEGNKYLDIKKHFKHFSGRLDTFMALSDAVVVMPGGIGTTLELFYTWQLTQVKHICHIPIIVVGQMWEELVKWVEQYPIKQGLASPEDASNVFCVKDVDEALDIIRMTKKAFEEGGKDACINAMKYKLQ